MSLRFESGKHKGRTITEVGESNLDYLQWYVSKPELAARPVGVAIGEYLKGRGVAAPPVASAAPAAALPVATGTIGFGKYKGQPVATLMADKDYCAWLVKQDWFRRNSLYSQVLASLPASEAPVSVYATGSSGLTTPGSTVEFGKYKGQSWEALLADHSYCAFLSTVAANWQRPPGEPRQDSGVGVEGRGDAGLREQRSASR